MSKFSLPSPSAALPFRPSRARASRALRSAVLPLLLAVAGGAAQAAETTNTLGLDAGLNLLVFKNMNVGSSDVQGRVAVGGNATLGSYSVNTLGWGALYSGTGLTVGGDLTFNGGSTWANTVVGGNLVSTGSSTYHGALTVGGDVTAQNGDWLTYGSLNYGGTAYNLHTWQTPSAQKLPSGSSVDLGINFAAEQSRLTSLSTQYSQLASTGVSTLQDGNLILNAGNAALAVFDLASADMLKNMTLTNVGANTTVLINVAGQAIDFTSHGYDGFASGQVLFNLYEATNVSFAAGVTASFLAPLASFQTTWGHIDGQVVAAGWTGGVQVNNAPFTGTITVTTPVPEPRTYAMLLAGLGVVTWLARRRQPKPRGVAFAVQ